MAANRPFFDANALWGANECDLLLSTSAKLGLDPKWSDGVLNEVRGVSRKYPERVTSEDIDRRITQMGRAFPNAQVNGYSQEAQAGLDLPADPKDRHVLRAAMDSGASSIVTDNISDFYQSHGDRTPGMPPVQTPGHFMSDQLEEHPDEVIDGVQEMLDRHHHPPSNWQELDEYLEFPNDPGKAETYSQFRSDLATELANRGIYLSGGTSSDPAVTSEQAAGLDSTQMGNAEVATGQSGSTAYVPESDDQAINNGLAGIATMGHIKGSSLGRSSEEAAKPGLDRTKPLAQQNQSDRSSTAKPSQTPEIDVDDD